MNCLFIEYVNDINRVNMSFLISWHYLLQDYVDTFFQFAFDMFKLMEFGGTYKLRRPQNSLLKYILFQMTLFCVF